MDARTRQGFLAVQFERLVEGLENRALTLETPVGLFFLIRHGNVVTCSCRLYQDEAEGQAALLRRGAVDGMFMISPKLAPRDFGAWLDRLLVDDLQADPHTAVSILTADPLAV